MSTKKTSMIVNETELPLVSPVTYQGAKGRLAARIIEYLTVPPEADFYDLCCGSGAVSLALIERGHYPDKLHMVDRGPWGLFWKSIGDGAFDIDVMRSYCDMVPADPREIKSFMERLRAAPIGAHGVYIFLLLQAAAFGGTPIALDGDVWKRCGFRDYWVPTKTSNRRYPVNPMMPMATTLFKRVAAIARSARGVGGIQGDAATIAVRPGSVVYIDPPYDGTTGYGHIIDAVSVAKNIASSGSVCWISEGRPLSDQAVCLSKGRAKGGITGNRKRAANEEWLSCFTKRIRET